MSYPRDPYLASEIVRLTAALIHIARTCVEDPDTAQFAFRSVCDTADAPLDDWAEAVETLKSRLGFQLRKHPQDPSRRSVVTHRPLLYRDLVCGSLRCDELIKEKDT